MHAIERGIYLTILGAVFVLSILFVFFVMVISRYQKRRAELYTQKIRAQTSWLEKEKERISTDLHDDLGVSLSAIKFQLQMLELQDEHQNRIIENAEKYIDEAMEKLREISYNMTPRILKDEGLKEAINDLIDVPASLKKIRVVFTYSADYIDDDVGLHIYRIIAEIFANILRHAKATEVLLSVLKTNNVVVLNIKDNGIGFNHREVLKKRGQGLQNIRHRIDMLGGKVDVNTLPGKGVNYFIKIPLTRNEQTKNQSNHRG